MRGGRRRDGRGCRIAGAARPWEEGERRELGHGAACEGGGGQFANEWVAKADTGESRKMAWSSASCPNPSRFESGRAVCWAGGSRRAVRLLRLRSTLALAFMQRSGGGWARSKWSGDVVLGGL